jgi:hypothetical protein
LNKLKAAIVSKFGSQYSFSKRLGIREELVCRIVTGRRKLNPEQVYEWSTVLGVDVQAILDEAAKTEAERAAE